MIITVLGVGLKNDTVFFSIHLDPREAQKTKWQIIDNFYGQLEEEDFEIRSLSLKVSFRELTRKLLWDPMRSFLQRGAEWEPEEIVPQLPSRELTFEDHTEGWNCPVCGDDCLLGRSL